MNRKETKHKLKNDIANARHHQNVLSSKPVKQSNPRPSQSMVLNANIKPLSSGKKQTKAPGIKSFLLKKTTRSASFIKTVPSCSKTPRKPILKSAKSTENLDSNSKQSLNTMNTNIVKKQPIVSSSKSNLIYQKSKSAENLLLARTGNRASMKSLKSSSYQMSGSNGSNVNGRKTLDNSHSSTSINLNGAVNTSETAIKAAKSNELTIAKGGVLTSSGTSLTSSSDKKQQQQKQNACEIINLDKNETTESNLSGLIKDFDYFELLEFLTEKSKNLKQENRKLFISKIINLLTSAEQMKSQSNNENELEKKLDEMKFEIQCLKQQLSSAPPFIPIMTQNTDQNEQVINVNNYNNVEQQQQTPVNPADLNSALNLIISNYFEKLTKMQQQIDELNNLNKCLFYIEKNMNYEHTSNAMMNNHENNHVVNESNVFSCHVNNNTNEIIERLESELRVANEKSQQMSRLLEEKHHQSEQYINLFK